MLAILRSGDWLTRDRAVSYAGILVVLEILVLLFFVLGTNGMIVELGVPLTTAFASFYAAGQLALEGTPGLAYDQAAHLEAIWRVTEPGVGYFFYYYPPVFMLVCAVMALMPYLPAFYVFQAVTLAVWMAVARATLREPGLGGWMLVLASPAIYWTLGLGQNAFLTAAAFGGALLLVDRRPFLAGLLFGLVCYKPHFGLLIPVALVAGGHWRAFIGAAVSVVVLVGLSLAVFGWQTWQDYLVLFAGASGTYEHGRIDLAAFVSPFGGARLIGIPVPASYALQAASALAAAVSVWWVWRRKASLPVRAAVLCASVPVAVHVALLYDMVLSAIAIFWLIRAARETGWMPWEKTLLMLVLVAPLVSRIPLGMVWHIPLGPVAAVALLVLSVLHARWEIAGHRTLRRAGQDA